MERTSSSTAAVLPEAFQGTREDVAWQMGTVWGQIRAPVVVPLLQVAVFLCLAMSVMLLVEKVYMAVVVLVVKLLGRRPERRYKWEPIRDDLELGNHAYPMVLVQIPMYNEREVYQLSIGAACGLSWPSDRIIIQVRLPEVEGGGESGANTLSLGYSKGTGLAAEIIGTFVLVYTVFSATDPKRNARDSHVPVLAPLPIGFAVFMVHLATIPITGTGINPARSLGAAVIFNVDKVWDDQWIFWLGPFVGAALAAAYHQYILRAGAIKALGSFRSNPQV